ncbi:MAG: enolase C-terminal domain-like protein [Nitrososphaerales archaeon]|jgi:enolase
MQIQDVRVRVCFNGRGDLGIEADVIVAGHLGRALSPSGASLGGGEALPFADGSAAETASRFQTYRGRLIGQDAADIDGLSRLLREIDGTKDYSRIGGSLAYAVSVAAAEAEGRAVGLPLCGVLDPSRSALPFPLGNVIGGGKHASDLSPSMQEILVTAVGAESVAEAEALNFAVHKAVGRRLSRSLAYPLGRGDEGGWAPGIADEEALLVVAEEAARVQDEKGRRIRVGLDVAADSLYDGKKGGYFYRSTGKTLSREEQISFIGEIRDRFDLLYIEDPLQEDDFEGFARIRAALGSTLVVGDDIYTTNPERLELGMRSGSTNGVIVKVNQVGTLGEAARFSRLARENGQTLAASHRSGDNEGGHLAHFAVGFGCGLMKCGIVGGERTAKVNELIRISESLGGRAAMDRSWVP